MRDYLSANPWLLRVMLIAGGFLIGFIIEKVFIRSLKSIAKKTKWEWDDVIIASLHWMPVIWCVTAGIYAITYFKGLAQDHKILIDKILVVVIISSVTIILARLASGFVRLASAKTQAVIQTTTLFSRTTSLIIYMIGGFIILQNLHIEITPLLTALGVGGLAVALALQDTLNNLFSGIQIIVTRQVRPGDYVRLDSGQEGYVTDIKGRNTTIRSFPNNNLIIVPNSKLVSSIVTNYNLPQKQMWVSIPVGISYDSDLEHVERVALEVARDVLNKIKGGMTGVDPIFRYEEFGDSSINFNIRLVVKEFADHFLVKHDFIKALHKRFDQEGIEIPFPIRTVHMKNAG